MGFWPTFSWLSLLPDSMNLLWRPLVYFTCGYNYLLPCVSLILLKIIKFVTLSFCTVHKGHSPSSVVPHPTPLFSPMFPWPIFQFISFKLLSLNFSSIFLYLGSLTCLRSLFFMISFSIWIHDADSLWGGEKLLLQRGTCTGCLATSCPDQVNTPYLTRPLTSAVVCPQWVDAPYILCISPAWSWSLEGPRPIVRPNDNNS